MQDHIKWRLILASPFVLLASLAGIADYYGNIANEQKNIAGITLFERYRNMRSEDANLVESESLSINYVVVLSQHAQELDNLTYSPIKEISDEANIEHVDSIETVIIVDTKLHESRQYKVSGKYASGLPKANKIETVKTYRLKLWVFDNSSRTLIGYKEFRPAPLQEKHYGKPASAPFKALESWLATHLPS